MTLTMRSDDRPSDAARAIREAAFVRERDWRPEFDAWDEPGRSVHLTAFDGGRAVGVCRFYADPGEDLIGGGRPGRYVIARLAVPSDCRGRGIGSMLLDEAERRIALAGGVIGAVHAEDDRYPFYERRGYRLTADVYEDGLHGWLDKDLTAAGR